MAEKYQIKKWIEKVIKSSNTWDQLTTCEKLINNFKKQMEKDDYDKMLSLPFLIDLDYKIKLKRKELIEINNFLKN
jgi:hypothetical protein